MEEAGSTPTPDERSRDGERTEAEPFDPAAAHDLLAHAGEGVPLTDDFVDPDLVRLSRRPSVLQLLLVLVVAGFSAFVAWTLRGEVAYFFAEDTPVDLGAAEDMAVNLHQNPDLMTALGSNIYARVGGVPQRRATSGDRQFAQLVGAPIFVEDERQDIGANPLLRDVRTRRSPTDERRTRYYIEAAGRLLRVEDLGARYRGFVEFYRDGYDLWFCGEPLTRRQQDFRRLTASDLEEELGREPTQAEIDAAYPCVHGFLLQAGRAPSDHLWYLVAYGFIALILAGGLWYAIRWARQMRAALRT